MNDRRVVISGLGVVSPLGNSKETFWNNLVSGKSGIRTIQSMDTTNYDCKIGGEVVDFDPTPFFNNHKEARRADRFFQFAMAAAKMAVMADDDNDSQRSMIKQALRNLRSL
jgi:3-oxoacyl-[acyl-carrier-protein] synthase II